MVANDSIRKKVQRAAAEQ